MDHLGVSHTSCTVVSVADGTPYFLLRSRSHPLSLPLRSCFTQYWARRYRDLLLFLWNVPRCRLSSRLLTLPSHTRTDVKIELIFEPWLICSLPKWASSQLGCRTAITQLKCTVGVLRPVWVKTLEVGAFFFFFLDAAAHAFVAASLRVHNMSSFTELEQAAWAESIRAHFILVLIQLLWVVLTKCCMVFIALYCYWSLISLLSCILRIFSILIRNLRSLKCPPNSSFPASPYWDSFSCKLSVIDREGMTVLREGANCEAACYWCWVWPRAKAEAVRSRLTSCSDHWSNQSCLNYLICYYQI